MEHEEQADQLEHEAEGMAEDSEKVGEQIEETRRAWEAKEEDRKVPGAKPENEDDTHSVAGAETDEKLLSEEGGP